MSSTRKAPVRHRSLTSRSTLSVLVTAVSPPLPRLPSPALAPRGRAAEAPPWQLPPAAPISQEERRRRIAEVAYRYAEQASFRNDPVADWLMAEREVDAQLSRKAS